ncbi:MAG: septal ring lytic transglycosylase RlpA family protein [Euzebyaceae bacterium]|nr:septal ring lytic transglycosylase RlpA family protein [Euzebyaceae bacterium]
MRFVLSAAAVLLVLPAAPRPASADDLTMMQRSFGPDRITTAVDASRDFRETATDVLLATAAGFPDALAAGALANRLHAPLLLTTPGALPAVVAEELQRLQTETVWILGGENAVSAAVEADLAAAGYQVRRLSGRTRYSTAAEVAQAAGGSESGDVVVALGEHADPARAWPDAVAAGALSATPDRVPTLLTRANDLPEETVAALAGLKPSRVLLLGGEAAIRPAVEAQLAALGYDVDRVAGTSRYETSVQLADEALRRFGGGDQPAVFASGRNYPDALSAGTVAAALGAPLILVPPRGLSASADRFLRDHADRWTSGVMVGGPAAANDYVVAQLDAALQGVPAPEPEPAPQAPAEIAGAEVVVSTFSGTSSWYGPGFEGNRTASGEIFDPQDLTAAHRTLPFGTRLRVTNTGNGAQVTVRINDRGPFHGGRVLDVSSAAADHLGMKQSGTAPVFCEVLAG